MRIQSFCLFLLFICIWGWGLFCFILFFSETGSHDVALASLELAIQTRLPQTQWNLRYITPCLAQSHILEYEAYILLASSPFFKVYQLMQTNQLSNHLNKTEPFLTKANSLFWSPQAPDLDYRHK